MVLACFTAVEAVGGFWSHSIALLAEAAHMLADCGSLVLAALALRVGRRPARSDRTYGHRRYEPLAAYTNGILLLAITAGILFEALRRLVQPAEVNAAVMLAVAAIGGIANLSAFLILAGGRSLNERGARSHVLSDLLGSLAAVIAAVLILTLGWQMADPLLSLIVAALTFRFGWRLTSDSSHVLLEGTPRGFDAAAVERELRDLDFVRGIHHVHVWSLTGEAPILTCHIEVDKGADRPQVLAAVTGVLRERFGVEHATVQFEEGECVAPVDIRACHEERQTE